jgi:release factor glutamine methyltransferase
MEPDPLVAALRGAGCVYAEEEAALLRSVAGSAGELEAMAARRVAGEPLEQVVGFAEVDGLRVAVAPGVFVPRLRSLALVRVATAGLGPGDVVVDLCCGTGALGALVLRDVPGVEVWAADLDPDAVACARRNLPPDRVLEGDLFAALPTGLRGRVAAVVCNAPYVPTAQIAAMPAEARDHEHRIALDGGSDGLDLHRRVLAEAPGWLVPGGRVLLETSVRQSPATAALARAAGLAAEVVRDEEVDGTVVVATRG